MLNQISLKIKRILVILATAFIAQNRAVNTISLDLSQDFQLNFGKLYELQYDNTNKQEMLEFTAKIQVSSGQQFGFLLLASGFQLQQNTFVTDILDIDGSQFENYANQKDVQILAIDDEGLASAKSLLAIQIPLQLGQKFDTLYFYLYGPYEFGGTDALRAPKFNPPTIQVSVVLKNRMNCQNNCFQSQSQGVCQLTGKEAYCQCTVGYIDRDCGQNAKLIKIGDGPIQVGVDNAAYLYFDITKDVYQDNQTLVVSVQFTTQTEGLILSTQVNEEKYNYIPDYYLWLYARQQYKVAKPITNQEIKYGIDMSQSNENSRIVFLIYAKDSTQLQIEVYLYQVGSLDTSMLILYIILGVLGFLVLLYIIYIARRSKILRQQSHCKNEFIFSFYRLFILFHTIKQTKYYINIVFNIDLKIELGLNLQVVQAQQARVRQPPQQILTADQINEYMPPKDYDQHMKNIYNSECSVCLEEFIVNKDQVRSTICQHLFHCECLGEWLKKQYNCPFCRQELTLEKLKEFQKNPIAYQQISAMKVKQIQANASLAPQNNGIQPIELQQQNINPQISDRIIPPAELQQNQQIINNNNNNNNNNNQIERELLQNNQITTHALNHRQKKSKEGAHGVEEEQVHMTAPNVNNLFNPQDENTNLNNTAVIFEAVQQDNDERQQKIDAS